MPTARTLRNRAERGAAWLDEHIPGWETKIDLNKLNLAEPKLCVLGQVGKVRNSTKSGFYRLAEKFGLFRSNYRQNDTTKLGFDAHDCDNIEQAYEILDNAWFSEIVQRRRR